MDEEKMEKTGERAGKKRKGDSPQGSSHRFYYTSRISYASIRSGRTKTLKMLLIGMDLPMMDVR